MGIEEADDGQILLDGEDITSYDINHRANAGIGFAFQQPPRFKGMTVDRLLSLAAGRELSEPECCKMLSGVGPVSYTHLDVYKRQGIFSLLAPILVPLILMIIVFRIIGSRR